MLPINFCASKKALLYPSLSCQLIISALTLSLLKLSTSAGSAHTLNKIREAYKYKALEIHPDAGGSTDEMRKLNDAYQLLKNMYRK